MSKIQVFNREIEDGIADSVKSQASVAYLTPVTNYKLDVNAEQQEIDKLSLKIQAENKDQIDLYYLESVLVSTNWNKNDDVFLPNVTWAARNTPEDKQFNFMHNENDIIGHITGSYVVDRDGNKVPNDTETPPSDFDIITRAVLYNSWTQEDNRDRMNKIISELDEGKWFVSMECLFAGFDYSVIDPLGNKKLVTRNEESAFLTKHLRSYGGTGEYEGYKVGRALSNISFSGKGLVSNPANPRSIILNSKSVAFNVDTHSLIGETEMADSKVLEGQLAEVKDQLATVTNENEALKSEITELKVTTSKVESLEASVGEKDTLIQDTIVDLKAANDKVKELTDSLAEIQATVDEQKEELKKKEKEEKFRKRQAALVEAGFDTDEVEANLASFDALDDEAFDSIVALYSKKTEAVTESKKDTVTEASETEEVETEEAEAEVEEELLDDVKSDEVTFVEAGENTTDTIREKTSAWIAQAVFNHK
jgi:hypothetical protein